MSKDLNSGFHYIVNIGGIRTTTPTDESDPHGRKAYEENYYYPKLEGDAEGYMINIFGMPLYETAITQIKKTRREISFPTTPNSDSSKSIQK